MDAQRPTRLTNDPSREAVDSLGGYAYQLWQSLFAWLHLSEGERLFLEGAEDIDLLRGSEAVVSQTRIHSRPITLNTKPIRDAIGHYWEHVQRNSDRVVHYRYVTPASVGSELTDDFGFDRPGLELWADIQRLERPEDYEGLVDAMRRHLLGDEAIAPNVRAFLSDASLADIRNRLIVPVRWDVNAATQEDVIALVRRAIVAMGRDQQLTGPQSRMAIPALLQRIFEKASARDDRWLDHDDLVDAFETATSIPVRVNQLAVLLTESAGAPTPPSDEAVLDPLPGLPPRFYHRANVFAEMQRRLGNRLLILIGSSGVGKTAAAVDYAGRSGLPWAYIDLRGRTATEADHILRVAIRTFPSGDAIGLVIDDLPSVGDVRRYERALSRVVDFVVGNGRDVVVTSYSEPAPSLRAALRLDGDAVYPMPMFTEEDAHDFLRERGASDDAARRWQLPIVALTGGHPTLVDARVLDLEGRGFPPPAVDDIFEQPQEVHDAQDQARRYIATIDIRQRTLLYRASISTYPIRREHLTTLGAANIPGEGPVERPGEVVDQLLGPWLELAPGNRYHLSPLAFGAGPIANNAAWTVAAHHALGRALMSLQTVDVRDAALAVLHAFHGEDAPLLSQILELFMQAMDDDFWIALGRFAPWFSALAVDTPTHELLNNLAILSLLRCAQYRVARGRNDVDNAARIVAAFNAEVPDDDFHLPLRFIFYSVICVYSAEGVRTELDHVISWIHITERATQSANAFVLAMAQSLTSLPGATGDIAQDTGALVFGAVNTYDDLEGLTERLEREDANISRRLVTWIEQTPVAWRGVVANMIVDQRDGEDPDFPRLAEALEHFENLCNAIGATALAIEASASAIRVLAEFADNVTTARTHLDAARERYGNVPRLRLVDAVITHLVGDARGAIPMFQEAIGALEYSEDDIEPASDLRLAAIDAGTTDEYELASELLEVAATHTILATTPFLRLGLLFDAAYGYWRAGEEQRSLQLAESAADELIAIEERRDEPAYLNLTRRIGHAILAMGRGTPAVAAQVLPAIGYLSDLELLEDEAITPTEMLLVSIANMEARLSETPLWFEVHREILFNAGFPVSGFARHIASRWAIKLGDPLSLLDDLHEMFTTTRQEMITRGSTIVATETPYIPVISAAFVSSIGRGTFDTDQLALLAARAGVLGISTLEAWLRAGINYFANVTEAMASFRGQSTAELQLLAGLVISSNFKVGPRDLFLAQTLWIDNLGQVQTEYPMDEVILQAMERTWRHTVVEQRIHLSSPMYTVPRLLEALEDSSGTGWQRISRTLRAVAQASDTSVPARTIGTLRNLDAWES
jgi:tetratricopeptide (TPR) repeat protein